VVAEEETWGVKDLESQVPEHISKPEEEL